jgi:hypothetical protein
LKGISLLISESLLPLLSSSTPRPANVYCRISRFLYHLTNIVISKEGQYRPSHQSLPPISHPNTTNEEEEKKLGEIADDLWCFFAKKVWLKFRWANVFCCGGEQLKNKKEKFEVCLLSVTILSFPH